MLCSCSAALTKYDSHEAPRNITLAIGKGGAPVAAVAASANISECLLGKCGIRAKMIRPRGW
jgi:hypothetical protein